MLPAKDSWVPADRIDYISLCTIDQLKKEQSDYEFSIGYCLCTQDKLELLYSVDDLISVPEKDFDIISNQCFDEYNTYVHSWEDIVIVQYISECIKGISSKGYDNDTSSRYCGCTIALLQANYSFQEINNQDVSRDDIANLSNMCNEAFLLPTPVKESVTEEERELFISSCMETESQGLGIDISEVYCECLLDKTLSIDSKKINRDSLKKIRNECVMYTISREK